MIFHKMDTKEVSDRFVTPCFVNGLEAYDGKINLGVEENMISNEYAVKLCLEHEVKRRNKMVKKELIVALRGGTYLVKFIINPKEDDVEPVALTREETEKEALSIRISQRFALLEEVRPVLETIAYHDKEEEAIKKVKGEALKENDDPGAFIFPMRLEGREEMKKVDRWITMINHTQTEAMVILTNVLCQVGVTTLIAKFLILDILIDRDAPIVVGRGFLCTIGGIVNNPERLFSTFDRICHQTFRAARSDVLRTVESDSNDEEEYEIKRNKFGALMLGLYHADELDEEGFDVYFEGGLRSDEHFNAHALCQRTIRYDKIQKNDLWLLSMFDARYQNGYENVAWLIARWIKRKGADDVIRIMSGPIYCIDLDATTLRELIDSEGRLILEDPQPGVPRVGIPRPPRASMQDFYDRIEIRQEAIERIEYKKSHQ
uniref:Uncharacterized protein n=1 Tax=Tanacetum cinerariifolium TaxID=118510 RepID=A0A6L2KLD0_TANCI|nr:hypothetical protein [Tanacetum cinerariifolium]